MTQIVLNQVLAIFLLTAFGFVLKKINLLNDGFTKSSSDLIVYVTLPAMIINSMDREFSRDVATTSLQVFLTGAIMYACTILLSFVLVWFRKFDETQRGVYMYMVIFGNVGYLGYPVMNVLYGEMGIFYSAVFNIWFNILTWTIGVSIMARGKLNLRRILINPGLISTLFGLFVFLTPLTLPTLVKSVLENVGSMTTPLAMFLVGAFLAEARMKDFVADIDLYLASVLKLVAAPLLVYLWLSPLHLPPIVKVLPIVMAGMPSGVNTAVFARMFDKDYRLAAQGVVLSTALSMISLPVLILTVVR
ncbi:MAG: Auxin Efflux Carrier [Thermotoga sp. 50_1627]|uniref:AEC family transporter n=1 Tax=Pseudothermotoga sp. TaxID=2033661 RepID=UPI00076C1ED8|nr:MAG: Auxin Efflux Carrier [Thermotoga sp. 50_64]KUK25486.1 MAG: Auxin Efflux Carrier [Thermotoga sp. 50_1627]MBC7115760.1 AEC family transporter [Pseudothermotoga sp.]MDK2922977.1 malate permease [Pseudothermotoga sp.]HBT38976.1 AEC family transporter [Pseudothermotoga sp.]